MYHSILTFEYLFPKFLSLRGIKVLHKKKKDQDVFS